MRLNGIAFFLEVAQFAVTIIIFSILRHLNLRLDIAAVKAVCSVGQDRYGTRDSSSAKEEARLNVTLVQYLFCNQHLLCACCIQGSHSHGK